MPYYIYRISTFPLRRLELLGVEANFAAASARTKALRAESPGEASATVRLVHAESELHAEDLLNQGRSQPPGLVGDE